MDIGACLFTTPRKGFSTIQLAEIHIGDEERHKSKKLNVGRGGAVSQQ